MDEARERKRNSEKHIRSRQRQTLTRTHCKWSLNLLFPLQRNRILPIGE